MALMVLEGLDGSGKTTQFRLLVEAFSVRTSQVREVKFPDYNSPSSSLVKMYLNGEFGNDPKDVNPYAASSFYAVDRFSSFQKDWQADYRAGKTILADRYVTSNYIYQMGKLPEDQWEGYLNWIEDFEYGKLGLPRPDRVIFLDMPMEVSQKLLSQRYHGDKEKRDIHESHLKFLKRCAACARFAGERLGWDVIRCAKGNAPLPVEEIHQRVLALALKTD